MAFSSLIFNQSKPFWFPPLEGLKLNFDGSAIGNLGIAGIGGIAYNFNTSHVPSYLGPVRWCLVNKAGFLVLRAGLQDREATLVGSPWSTDGG